jgi:hypothetical protein
MMFAYSAGYRGKNCEENIDDCPGNLCQNGATCVDDINRYSCMCPPTYMGELCEQDVDECGQRPSVCQNGATCTNSIGGFSCICVNGWAGPDCSVNIDDCAGAACFNGATCIDRVGSFYCRCTPGKTGKAWQTVCYCCGDCSDASWGVSLGEHWHTGSHVLLRTNTGSEVWSSDHELLTESESRRFLLWWRNMHNLELVIPILFTGSHGNLC